MSAPTLSLGSRGAGVARAELRRRDARRAVAPLALAAWAGLVASSLATVYGLCRVFPGWSFAPRLGLIAITVHGLGLVGRYRRWPLWLVAVASAAATAVLVAVIYHPTTTALGVLPTRATWDAAWQAVADSWSQFRVTVTPVPPDGGFGLSCALAIAGIAFVSDAFAFRAFGRAEAVVPGGLLFVIASSLGYDRLRLVSCAVWLVAAVTAVALLRAAHNEPSAPWLGAGPTRRVAALGGGALGAGLAAALLAVAIGPRLPGADAEALVDTRNRAGDGTEVISPLVDVQARLVNRSNVELFTVVTDRPAYLRLTSLEAFDGSQWRQERDYDDQDQLGSVTDTTGVRQEIEISSLGSIWLPAAFSPAAIESTVDIRFNAESGSIIRERGELFDGLDYTVVSQLPSATADQLGLSTSSAAPGEDYLQLPDDFPDAFRRQAAEITADAGSAYEQALALQNWFRSNFTYNQNVPRGHSERAMESFLNQREGYCEQFAGTFAAFARSLGLAARVAVGFTPGDIDEAGVYHVLGKHAHAWPEVWFDGIGWVLFEPTPGRGAPGSEAYTGVQPAQAGGVLTGTPDQAEPSGQGGQPVPVTSAPRATVPSVVQNDGEQPGGATGAATTTTIAPTSGVSGGTPPVLTAFLVVALAAVLWMLAMPTVVRAVRAGRSSGPSGRILTAWHDATVALAQAGAPRRPEETPIEHAERAWRMTGVDRHGLRRLAELATAAAFGARDPSDEAAEESARLAAEVRASLFRRSTLGQRLRRRIDPRLV